MWGWGRAYRLWVFVLPGGIKVVGYGVGAIGSQIARFIIEGKEGLEYVGAIDVDPGKAGRDVGEVVGLGRNIGVAVSSDAGKVLSEAEPDIVVHATKSYLRDVFPQIVEIVGYGVNVISTCEELSYPYIVDEELARRLDMEAKRHGVTVLGTGVNPGFLMDLRPIMLTGPCLKVDRIRVIRRLDAGTRRTSFQRKIGAGLSVGEFMRAIRSGSISGHVGLEQSIAMIASAIGWDLDRIEVEPAEPVVLDKAVSSGYTTVEPGRVAGLRQSAKGYMGGVAVIELEFVAYIGAEEEYDLVEIDGLPEIKAKIAPCIHGDYGTVAMIVNMIPKVINAPPGLVTMKDLPPPCATMANMERFIRR